MSPPPRREDALRERIRASSKAKVIQEDMARLGFWGQAEDPLEAEALHLAGQLHALERELVALDQLEAQKEAAHKERLRAAKARRAEARERRERARRERAAAWASRQATDILFLGEGVSDGLASARKGNPDTVRAYGLPVFDSISELAHVLNETVGGLRWLAFHRAVSQTSHYTRFAIPKKAGGERIISAPLPRLKAAQSTIAGWLSAVPLHPAAHGFVPGRSIVTNATPHVGCAVVVNFDLEDFFPSIDWIRVRGIFEQLGYGRPIATVLALLCTEAEVETLEIDGKRWFVQTSTRRLPQGSPASPVLTNLLCRRLDARLAGLASRLQFTYTRYADDLTFSLRPGGEIQNLHRLLYALPRIVVDENLRLHPKKTRIMHRGRRQEVTGLVVNQRVSVPREQLHRYRAVVHQLRHRGPHGLQWGSADTVFGGLLGFAAFVHMVDAEKGTAMLREVRALGAQHGWTPPRRPSPAAPDAPAPEDEEGTPPPASTPMLEYLLGGTKKWWQFWR